MLAPSAAMACGWSPWGAKSAWSRNVPSRRMAAHHSSGPGPTQPARPAVAWRAAVWLRPDNHLAGGRMMQRFVIGVAAALGLMLGAHVPSARAEEAAFTV